jgi:hypothetical protein
VCRVDFILKFMMVCSAVSFEAAHTQGADNGIMRGASGEL